MGRPTFRDRAAAKAKAEAEAKERARQAKAFSQTRPPSSQTVVTTVPEPTSADNPHEPAPKGVVLGLRPADSQIVPHKDKGKGKAKEKKATSKKRQPIDDKGEASKRLRRTELPRAIPEAIPLSAAPVNAEGAYNDASASAAIFSRITCPGDHLPPSDTLLRDKAYSEMSLRGVKFISHLNRMVMGYESDARKDREKVEDARRKAIELDGKLKETEANQAAEQEKAVKRIKDLEADAEGSRKHIKEADERIMRLESGKARRDAHIASLTRQLEAANELHDSKLEQAVLEAKREMFSLFEGKVSRAMMLLGHLDGEPKENMIDLAQIEGNLQFIGLLQSDEPPSLDAEVTSLAEQRDSLNGAHEAFAQLVAEMKGTLKLSPIRSNILKELNDGEPLETAAASVGIRDFSGSNKGTPGLADFSSKEVAKKTTPKPSSEKVNEVVLEEAVVEVIETVPGEDKAWEAMKLSNRQSQSIG